MGAVNRFEFRYSELAVKPNTLVFRVLYKMTPSGTEGVIVVKVLSFRYLYFTELRHRVLSLSEKRSKATFRAPKFVRAEPSDLRLSTTF